MASHLILCGRGYGPRAIWRRLVLGLMRCVFDNCDFYLVLTNKTKQQLNQLMSLDIRSPVLHNGRTWVTDYLIAAQSSKTSTAGLSVFTGSNE